MTAAQLCEAEVNRLILAPIFRVPPQRLTL